jgi:hypothetical protein
MELEAKHLVPYLPYELKFGSGNQKYYEFVLSGIDFYTRTDIQIRTRGNRIYKISDLRFKPILRPLSDYADINSDAMNSLNCDMSEQINLNELAIGYICLGSLYQSTYDLCLKNHIDVFGLIPQGLALPLI